MKIEFLSIELYLIPMISGLNRSGCYLTLTDNEGNTGCGEIAPLPNWSIETLEDALAQLNEVKAKIVNFNWTAQNCLKKLKALKLYPSLSFGLESALLSILSPLAPCKIKTSAFLMGSIDEILNQADFFEAEKFTSAKLKVGNLSFDDAYSVIKQLKDRFFLRIDVNRAWETQKALDFFAHFPKDSFDYIEEPFKNPRDLALFTHPLAIDESYPADLSLNEVGMLPTLKALIFKPMMQGGLLHLKPLHNWAEKRGVALVIGSSFENYIGLTHVASLAKRLEIDTPVGIGTYFQMQGYTPRGPLKFTNNLVKINITGL